MLLTSCQLSRTDNRLFAATSQAFSASVSRTHTDLDASITGKAPQLLETDSARLLEEGIAATVQTFEMFLDETHWSRNDIDKTVCHQVGSRAHRLLLAGLRVDAARDFVTFEDLGNTGAVAIPLSMALAEQREFFNPGNRIALVGTGAGINSIIMGVKWQGAIVAPK